MKVTKNLTMLYDLKEVKAQVLTLLEYVDFLIEKYQDTLPSSE